MLFLKINFNDEMQFSIGTQTKGPQGRPILNTLMYTLVPIMAITFMVAIGYWMYRRPRMAYFNEVLSREKTS